MTVRKVLCPIDLSPASKAQIAAAAALAERFGARLYVQHDVKALPPTALGVGWMQASLDHDTPTNEATGDAVERIRALIADLPPSVHARIELTQGPRARAIVALARILPADVVVMTTHGGEDSVTHEVLEQTPCPLLVLHDGGAQRVPRPLSGIEGRIVVPVDLTPMSSSVLSFAFELAAHVPGDIDLLHVSSPYSSDAGLQLRALVPEALAPRVRVTVRSGLAAQAISDEAAETDADLIVVGVRHRGLLERLFLRSTSEDVFHHEARPVLFVPERPQAA